MFYKISALIKYADYFLLPNDFMRWWWKQIDFLSIGWVKLACFRLAQMVSVGGLKVYFPHHKKEVQILCGWMQVRWQQSRAWLHVPFFPCHFQLKLLLSSWKKAKNRVSHLRRGETASLKASPLHIALYMIQILCSSGKHWVSLILSPTLLHSNDISVTKTVYFDSACCVWTETGGLVRE